MAKLHSLYRCRLVRRIPSACNPAVHVDGSVLIVVVRECIVVSGSDSAPRMILGVDRLSILCCCFLGAESTACVCKLWRIYFLLVPSFGRTGEWCLEWRVFLLVWVLALELWCNDTCGPPLDSSQGIAQKACLSGFWLSVWGTHGGGGQYWSSYEPLYPSSELNYVLSVSSWSPSHLR